METPVTVYTIGHSNISGASFVEALKAHAVEVVIDVRSKPWSRFSPQFNRPELSRVLPLEGIQYVYMGDRLGGYPEDQTCYMESAPGKRVPDYDAIAAKPWFGAGLREALAMAKNKRVALMCSEEDPGKCHRHKLLAYQIFQRGGQVVHIRKGGALEPAEFPEVQKSLFE